MLKRYTIDKINEQIALGEDAEIIFYCGEEFIRIDDMVNYLNVCYNIEYGERRKVVKQIKDELERS
jgi:hypothetical protein